MSEEEDFRFLKEYLSTDLVQPCTTSTAWDGAEIYKAGDPPEVIVRLTSTEVQVYRPSFFWRNSHELTRDPQLLGTLNWRLLGRTDTFMACDNLIQTARRQRRESFRKCKYCGIIFGPEHMDGDVCHGCEEKHLHVVH
jgi:hypothetical protein